jgi:hypothetical protein
MVVLRYPIREAFLVLVDEIVGEVADLAVDDDVLVDRTVFAATVVAAKEAQDPGRIVATPDPAAHPHKTALGVKTTFMGLAPDCPGYFILQRFGEPLIGVQEKDPFAFDRKFLDCKVSLL